MVIPACIDRLRSLPVTKTNQRCRAVRLLLGLWLTLLLSCLTIQPAHAGDPELLWRTIETEHFRISYHEPLGRVAQRLAQVAETSH